MSRYIDDDEALKIIKKMLYETALNNFTTDRKFADDCEEIAEHRLATWVSLVPTADVVERKHGEWLETSESIGWEEVGCAECSVCGKTLVLGDYTMDDIKFNYNYCPNCGAEMKHD